MPKVNIMPTIHEYLEYPSPVPKNFSRKFLFRQTTKPKRRSESCWFLDNMKWRQQLKAVHAQLAQQFEDQLARELALEVERAVQVAQGIPEFIYITPSPVVEQPPPVYDDFIVAGPDDNDDDDEEEGEEEEEVSQEVPPPPPPPVVEHPPHQPRRSRRIAAMTPPVLRRSPRLALLPRVSYVGMC